MVSLRLVLAMAGVAVVLADFEKPWFCHDLDCPEFTSKDMTLSTGETVEVRSYHDEVWTSTTIEGTSVNDAAQQAFYKLFDYISGENETGETIEMTAPVIVYITPGQGPNCASSFKVSFYVPYKYQDAMPPAPTAEDVFTETIESVTVAVAGFAGFAQDSDVVAYAADLAMKLESEGVTMPSESYFYAGYDPPFRLTGRHNEVWIPIEG